MPVGWPRGSIPWLVTSFPSSGYQLQFLHGEVMSRKNIKRGNHTHPLPLWPLKKYCHPSAHPRSGPITKRSEPACHGKGYSGYCSLSDTLMLPNLSLVSPFPTLVSASLTSACSAASPCRFP